MRSALAAAIMIAVYLSLTGWSQGVKADEPRYVLCIPGPGITCDEQISYTKDECAALPQMQGWAPGLNPFYCKSLPAPKPRG